MIRRRLCIVALALGFGLGLWPAALPAQKSAPPAPAGLADQSIGETGAAVTVVEYFSTSCHFCAKFHNTTWPELKAKYVDTGKVRFVLRDFPNDLPGLAGAMLARCLGEAKWYGATDRLLREQDAWTHAQNVGHALADIARAEGMSREAFDACMLNRPLYETIRAAALRARDEFGISSTPTFFINGEKRTGALTLEEFEAILAPLLK
ncbi:MAG: DsbA family protein [Pseudorhodoplanes sp.]